MTPDPTPNHSEAVPGVKREFRDGRHVHSLDDGTDYWDLVKRFRAGEVAGRRVRNAALERDVYFLEHAGRKYVLKVDYGGWGFGGEGRLERFFWKFVRGPYYSRLIGRVNRARRNGCAVMQNIFLVAERRTLWYCHEAIILLEYVEGVDLKDAENPDQYLGRVADCLTRLHANDLALCDVSRYNFIVGADGGVTAIDLVCRGNPRLDRIKDVIRARKVFGLELPLRGWPDRLAFRLLSAFQDLRTRHRKWKKKRRPLSRQKKFR